MQGLCQSATKIDLHVNQGELLEALRGASMFSTCTNYQLERLAAIVDERDIPIGTTIFNEGSPSTEFYVVLAGEAELLLKNEIIGTYGPGQSFGEPALLGGEPRLVTVRSTTEMTLGVLDKAEFEDVLENTPHLTRKVLKAIAQQYCWMVTGSYAHLKAEHARIHSHEKLAALGTLTAGVAHEVSNPLNFIKNFAEAGLEATTELDGLVAELPVDEGAAMGNCVNEIKEILAYIGKHTERIEAIVGAILQYSGSTVGSPDTTDITELVQTSVEHGYREFRESGHPDFRAQIDISVRDHVTAIVCGEEIGRVIVNLVKNACASIRDTAVQSPKYHPELSVSVHREDQLVSISVCDNGRGISEEDLARVFDPFFTTRVTGDGTGLGLWLCNEIVFGRHGGTIDVDSEIGQFACFTVNLPIAARSVSTFMKRIAD